MPRDLNERRPGSPWMRPEAAAEYLGIALGTLRNWTSAGYVPHTKRGRVVRYHRDRIDEWLREGACSGRPTPIEPATEKARSLAT
jgi:excisionase family DNA binding protein